MRVTCEVIAKPLPLRSCEAHDPTETIRSGRDARPVRPHRFMGFSCQHGRAGARPSPCSTAEFRVDKTKARISPRLRQETFPLAGDAGFRPVTQAFALAEAYFIIIESAAARD